MLNVVLNVRIDSQLLSVSLIHLAITGLGFRLMYFERRQQIEKQFIVSVQMFEQFLSALAVQQLEENRRFSLTHGCMPCMGVWVVWVVCVALSLVALVRYINENFSISPEEYKLTTARTLSNRIIDFLLLSIV